MQQERRICFYNLTGTTEKNNRKDHIYVSKKALLAGLFLYRRWESNPHSRRNTILSRARLPIPPLRHLSGIKKQLIYKVTFVSRKGSIFPVL